MSEPCISVILPAYNVEHYIHDAVMSILNQTYYNLEIIIIDDGSTDDTFNILTELAEKDNRIKLYQNEQNFGLVRTLNKAISLVTGDYIARMDGDDISHPKRIDFLYNYLQEYPNVKLVGSQIRIIDENNNVTSQPNLPNSQKKIIKSAEFGSPLLHIWLCKKELYQKLHGYREILGTEDYDFVLRTLSLGYQIANHPERLYDVRIRQGNTITSIGIKQQISANYCVELYKERKEKRTLHDSYSETEIQRRLNVSEQTAQKFNLDFQIYQQGISLLKNKNFLGFLKIAQTFFTSNEIRNYIINRIRYKFYINW